MAERLRSMVTLLTLIGMICGQWVTVLCSVSHGHHDFDFDHDSSRPHWHIGASDQADGNKPRLHHHAHPHQHKGANDDHNHHETGKDAKANQESDSLIASFSQTGGDDHSIVYLPEFSATPSLRDSIVSCNELPPLLANAYDALGNEPLNHRWEWIVVVSRSVPVPRYLELLSIRC